MQIFSKLKKNPETKTIPISNDLLTISSMIVEGLIEYKLKRNSLDC